MWIVIRYWQGLHQKETLWDPETTAEEEIHYLLNTPVPKEGLHAHFAERNNRAPFILKLPVPFPLKPDFFAGTDRFSDK